MTDKLKGSKLLCVLLAVVMCFGISLMSLATPSYAASTTGFYVDGTTIRDANGNEFVMRGVNHAYAWYKDTIETAIKASAELGSNTVRIVLADGGQWTKTSAAEVETLIKMSLKYKVVPILELHDGTGKNSESALTAAVNYWVEIKDLLSKYEKYVIVNIANEWMGSWNGSSWASAYQTAIKTLRDAGIHNMLVVDAPGWGQDGPDCGSYCKSVFDADSESNTVFSIHMYGTAGKNAATIKSNIDGVIDNGVPLIIGEFGYKHSDGDVDEEYIMQYCTEKNVGYLGWSWKGNGGGVEYLDLVNEWDGSSLTEWGEILFNNEYGIKNTAKICSILEGDLDIDLSYDSLSQDDTSSDADSSADDSSASDSQTDSSSDDSSASSSTDSSSSSTGSNGSTAGTTGSTGSVSTGSTGSSGTVSVGSDSSAATGVSALAFVGIALAGAAAIINKKK